MKTRQILTAVFCGMLVLTFPLKGNSITTMSIQFEDTLRLISLDMPRREVIETLGTPDIIKSEGRCLQYEFMGLSVFINQNDQVEQIYLSRSFKGSVGNKSPFRSIQLSDVEREFGASTEVAMLNYQPSPIIQTKATAETENKTDPTGREKGEFPLQYEGNKKLYIFYNDGKPMKYKYVLDEEGIAFWMDQNMQLYATVLYASRARNAVVDLPVAEREPAPAKGKMAAEKLRLPIVHFDFDKYDIKKLYVPELDHHVAYLSQNPSTPLTIEGHTDSIGSTQYNQRLSERRANAVRRYLIEKGISSARIRIVGYGEQRPIADNKTPEGRALNRRAEFEVTVDK
jgi:outer membrane protein OmpA-like peptidoglycan-associated protein